MAEEIVVAAVIEDVVEDQDDADLADKPSCHRITLAEYSKEAEEFTLAELRKLNLDEQHRGFVRRFEEENSNVFRFTLLMFILITFTVFVILTLFPSPLYSQKLNLSAPINTAPHSHSAETVPPPPAFTETVVTEPPVPATPPPAATTPPNDSSNHIENSNDIH